MTWRNSWWHSVRAGLCLLLLSGCGDELPSNDNRVSQAAGEPTIEELGLLNAPVGLDLAGLSQAEINQVARGSYLVNGASMCSVCHTADAGYLAGGQEFPHSSDREGFTSVVSRNLTPDPETGLQLTEKEFIEALRTGKDFTDSTDTSPQRLLVMPWHIFRFMALDDLKAIYAFLQRIPPINNEIRKTFGYPFSPVPFPPIGDGDPNRDPNNAQRGLQIQKFFSAGTAADIFLTNFNNAVDDLTADEQAKVGRGSYLVNAIGACTVCHIPGGGPGRDANLDTALYLAGGRTASALFNLVNSTDNLMARNLTPDPNTGLTLSESEFVEVLRFGFDFRRPEGTLRVLPHFPTKFHHTLSDLQAIYAYLRTIPAVDHPVQIVP